MNPKILKFVVTGLIVLFAVFLDQWSKDWAETNLASFRFTDHTVSVTVDNAENTPTLEKLIETRYPKNPENHNKHIMASATRNGSRLEPQSSLQNGDTVELGEVRINVIDNYYDYEYARNKGAAFSFMADKSDTFRSIFFGITGFVAIILILGFIKFTSWKRNKFTIISLAFVLGGAVGNIIDRIRLGYVTDFISWHIGDTYSLDNMAWPTFNIADVFVTGGVAFLLIGTLIQSILEKKNKNDKNTAEKTEETAEKTEETAEKTEETAEKTEEKSEKDAVEA